MLNKSDKQMREGVPRQTLQSHSGLETSLWGSGDAVQREVVNQNESRDLGNTNTNIVLPNITALTSLIKTQDLPSHASTTERRAAVICDAYKHVHVVTPTQSCVHLLQGFVTVKGTARGCIRHFSEYSRWWSTSPQSREAKRSAILKAK